MSEKIDQFCNDLRERLAGVDERVKNFKKSVDSANAKAKADIQARLDKISAGFEERKLKAKEVHDRLQADLDEKKSETETKIEEWKQQRNVKKLEKRAQRAENYAVKRAWLALLAVEEAEYSALEALSARIEADEVAGG